MIIQHGKNNFGRAQKKISITLGKFGVKWIICKTKFTRLFENHLQCRVTSDTTFLQEEKSSASRKLIQPDLLAMSQLLNFDEVILMPAPFPTQSSRVLPASHACLLQEDEASDSEEEVPEVATAREVKREEGVGGSCEEGGGGTLNLTLDEVRHIRTALTRAELEVST